MSYSIEISTPTFSTELDTLLQLHILLSDADGCRRQGGVDQLDNALNLFNAAESILTQDLEHLWGCYLHNLFGSMCKAGIGNVFASQKRFVMAEKMLLEAAQGLVATPPPSPGEIEQVLDKAVLPYGLKATEDVLLDILDSLVNEVYLVAAADSSDAVLSATAMATSTSEISSISRVSGITGLSGVSGNISVNKASMWRNKAWEAVSWLVCSSVATDSDTSATGDKGLRMRGSVVADHHVHEVCGLIRSPTYLEPFLHETKRLEYLQRLLSLIAKVLVHLDRRSVAFELYNWIFSYFDTKIILLLPEQKELFSGLRQDFVRCMLAYCQADSDANTNLRGLVAQHLCILTGIQASRRSVAEMWGDWYRLRASHGGDLAIALCVYAACFRNHSNGYNSDMKRLADKIREISADGMGYIDSASGGLLGLDASLAPLLPFLSHEKIIEDGSRVDVRRLASILETSKVFSDRWGRPVLRTEPVLSSLMQDSKSLPVAVLTSYSTSVEAVTPPKPTVDTVPLSALTTSESVQLLIQLGCVADLKNRLLTRSSPVTVDGGMLYTMQSVDALQELEQDSSVERRVALVEVLENLQRHQRDGISLSLLGELRASFADATYPQVLAVPLVTVIPTSAMPLISAGALNNEEIRRA
eukprot:gene29265-35330_t